MVCLRELLTQYGGCSCGIGIEGTVEDGVGKWWANGQLGRCLTHIILYFPLSKLKCDAPLPTRRQFCWSRRKNGRMV